MLNSLLLTIFATSMFSLVAVSIDRCWAICCPVSYHVSGTAITKIMIISCWTLALFFGFVPSIWQTSNNFQGRCDVSVIAEFNFSLEIFVSITCLSIFVIIVLYSLVYRAILRQVSETFSCVKRSKFTVLRFRRNYNGNLL